MPSPFFPKRYADTVQRLRVPSGFLLAIAFAWLAAPRWTTLLAGLPVCAAGLALRAWAAGHLRKNERLTTSGPYSWVRNPLYLGTLLMAVGCTIAAAQPWLALLVAAVFLLVYQPVMEQEEQHLAKLFPEFADYAAQVPQLLPKRPLKPLQTPFSWAMYRHNREQKALYGLLMVLAFLVVRMLLS
ncbi:MAG: isoprenylcysteine carboxylmethyltransferase family protein [Bryobacteraceae bacterium]|nr:isoprenylcysteine carboxylmethyltransferase family protein [Solibacteraceae bacterium]MCO5351582.1 isoprenylcysteine carboxylmethyltransferase family protein [Bryobacteraceae bacterium]